MPKYMTTHSVAFRLKYGLADPGNVRASAKMLWRRLSSQLGYPDSGYPIPATAADPSRPRWAVGAMEHTTQHRRPSPGTLQMSNPPD